MKPQPAYRTITEVAEDLGLPAHVLRFWETKFPQIQPLKRGGGRRYYRPEDVSVLSRIQQLLHEQRYTIEGAQRLLASETKKATEPTALPVESLQAIRGELAGMLETLKKN